jgi:hypothetical protein
MTNPRDQWLSLASMRESGVHSVSIDCQCGHSAYVNVDHLDGAIKVPDVWRLYRCSKCQRKPCRSMPDWSEQKCEGKAGYPV